MSSTIVGGGGSTSMAASHFYEVGSRLKAKLQSTDVI